MRDGTLAVREIKHPSTRGEDSYMDVFYKNRWAVEEPTTSKVKGAVTAFSHHGGKDLLQRCLIGTRLQLDTNKGREKVDSTNLKRSLHYPGFWHEQYSILARILVKERCTTHSSW